MGWQDAPVVNPQGSQGNAWESAPMVSQPQPEQPKTLLERFKDRVAREAGLTARSAIEGVGDIVGIIHNPISVITGGAIRPSSEVYSDLANKLDLPKPETGTEKLASALTRGGVGAATTGGIASKLGKLPGMIGKFGEVLADNLPAQITSAMGGAGGSEIARQQGAGETGQTIAGIAGALTPTFIAKSAPIVGAKIADIVGGIGTHTGGEPLKQAAQAGLKGGATQQAFIENMRGNVPKEDVLAAMDANLQKMTQARSAAYAQNMQILGKNQTPLDFTSIKDAANNAMKIQTYTDPATGMTVSTARSTLPMQKNIAGLINEWEKLPDGFKTPMGLDALKKNIGDLRDSSAFGTPERAVADKVYHAVKDTIVKADPNYADAMKGYQEASDLLSDIRSTLSAKPNASVDTQMRKLQSIMRNNVNTNYGKRLDLVKQLEQHGGNEMLPALAGQALTTITPRGLGGAVMGGLGMGGYAMGGPALAIPILAGQSPRLTGETALKLGQAGRILSPLAESDKTNALLKAALYGGLGANQ